MEPMNRMGGLIDTFLKKKGEKRRELKNYTEAK